MTDSPRATVRALVRNALSGILPGNPPDEETIATTLAVPKEPEHGDFSSSIAFSMARRAGMTPPELAHRLADRLGKDREIRKAEAAGPGFVNMFLADDVWRGFLRRPLREGENFDRGNTGKGVDVNIEFVSANPTGPLHLGHCRGAVLGDALARLLEKTGCRVTREYYVNDAGAQVISLARSVHHRYLEAIGEQPGPLPGDGYPGDYVRTIAGHILERDGSVWKTAAEQEWLPRFREEAVSAMMTMIREDLESLGIRFDLFTSEQELAESGLIGETVARLRQQGLVHTGILPPPKGQPAPEREPEEQLLFASTRHGDDSDRPLMKADGSWTYFAGDLACHARKISRGHHVLVNVLGADHGGYVRRITAATRALSGGKVRMDVRLVQMVRLLEDGRPVRMSKRAGTFVTLADLVRRTGRDAVRFHMLYRTSEAMLDLDLARMTEKSGENPVFYVQYAHARTCSVMRQAEREVPGLLPEKVDGRRDFSGADLSLLGEEIELALARRIGEWPTVVEGAAASLRPHRVAHALHDLAACFHGYWTQGKERPDMRLVVSDRRETTRARLALVEAVRTVLRSGLGIIGIEPAEEMRWS